MTSKDENTKNQIAGDAPKPGDVFPKSLGRLEKEIRRVEEEMDKPAAIIDDSMKSRRDPNNIGTLGLAMQGAMDAKKAEQDSIGDMHRAMEEKRKQMEEEDRKAGRKSVFGGGTSEKEPEKQAEETPHGHALFDDAVMKRLIQQGVKTLTAFSDGLNAELALARLGGLKFRPGDIVKLKTCGPLMVVECCTKASSEGQGERGHLVEKTYLGSMFHAQCAWFDGKEDRGNTFSFDALQIVRKGPYHG